MQNIKPDSPKNTSLRELERSVESAIAMGYDQIYCLIDMDTKRKDNSSWQEYLRLKKKYHGKKVNNAKKGIHYEIRFFETDRCTELFFLYYFRYTGQNYIDSKAIEADLTKECGYEKTQRFFATHPLHQFFQSKGGRFPQSDCQRPAVGKDREGRRSRFHLYRTRQHVSGPRNISVNIVKIGVPNFGE